MGLAKGFHNAPKLYHDRTVRTPDKIVDAKSGLKQAGKGLGYGAYDAITGLVTQPYHGAKEEGAIGFLKGAGKGLGGLLLKPEAGTYLLVLTLDSSPKLVTVRTQLFELARSWNVSDLRIQC